MAIVNQLTYILILRKTIFRVLSDIDLRHLLFVYAIEHTDVKKPQKLINVQDGIRPYRVENQSKINKSYMYDYLRPKSTFYEKSVSPEAR